MNTRTITATLASLALLLAACGDDDGSEPASLDGGADAVEVGDDTEQGGEEEADGDTTNNDDDDAHGGSDDGADADVIDVRSDHPVEAQPGRWAVLDAGFVEFDLDDTGLVLVDVTAADGWRYDIGDDDPDEIEVDFHRDGVEREIEIEWGHGQLEIEIDSDVEPAEPGVYELGAAGSFEFRHTSGRLELADVVVADGWNLHIDEESSEEIEFTLRSGQETWDVDIELDDGQVELEIDYEVETTLDR